MTGEIMVTELDKDREFGEALTSVSVIQKSVTELVVDSASQMAVGSKWLARLKQLRLLVEDKRKHFTEPLNEILGAINARARTVSDPIKAAEKTVGEKMSAYQMEQDRLADEARRLADAAERKRVDDLAALAAKSATLKTPAAQERNAEKMADVLARPVEIVPEVANTVRTSMGATHFREDWKFEILSAKDLPREYLCPDESAIRKAVVKGAREIVGVRIYMVKTPVQR